MTKEEAIRIIKIVLAVAEDFEITVRGEEFTEEKCKEAVDMAIEALEQAPCTDAISREDALMALTGEYTDSPIEILPKAIKRINVLPPVNPAEKVGRWKRISMDKYSEHAKYWYRCDRCGEDNLGNTNYCPHCGVKMQEVEE